MKTPLDEKGLPSLAGYLALGVGTATKWIATRSKLASERRGMSTADVLRDGTTDRANSFRQYIGSAAMQKEISVSSSKLTQLLGDLVAFQTVTSEAHPTEDCFDYLEKHLTDAGLHVTRFSINQYPSLVANTQKNQKPRVLLQAHIDVVPAIETHFNLEKQGGKLYGRGVYDMKFAAACYLQLVDDLKNELDKYDFGIMFTSDEELGGQDGVSALLEQGYSADVCVLPDGGDNWEIETASKGVWIARAYTTGKSAHGSRPWEGESAIERLIGALQDVRKLFGEQHADSNTLSISKISGGSAMNQVADKAEATPRHSLYVWA